MPRGPPTTHFARTSLDRAGPRSSTTVAGDGKFKSQNPDTHIPRCPPGTSKSLALVPSRYFQVFDTGALPISKANVHPAVYATRSVAKHACDALGLEASMFCMYQLAKAVKAEKEEMIPKWRYERHSRAFASHQHLKAHIKSRVHQEVVAGDECVVCPCGLAIHLDEYKAHVESDDCGAAGYFWMEEQMVEAGQ